VKLLLDQNLSPRLTSLIADIYPESTHVRDVGLAAASDDRVWDYAAQYGFVIATKDSDFQQRSFLYGAPPKVVWLRCGNCSTDDLARLLREHLTTIQDFESDPGAAFLLVHGGG